MTGWKVYGDPFESGELANTNKFVTAKFINNKILIGVRTWIICYNDPKFTSLNMKIYSNEVVGGLNTCKKLLYTSTNTILKSEIITLDNGAKEIYFDFNKIPINGDDRYNFVLSGSGYVYSSSSHIAWMKAFPDPVYAGGSGYTPTMENMGVAPYHIYFIGGDF